MGFRKCPICELNYISDGEKSCSVCRRAQHGGDLDDMETLCMECGENPVMRGSELCAACLREARRQEKMKKTVDVLPDTDMDMGALDDMEVPIADESDIPESEMEEIHKGLGDGFMDDEDEESDMDEEEMD